MSQQALNNLALIENTLRSDPRCTGENGMPLVCLREVRKELVAMAGLVEAAAGAQMDLDAMIAAAGRGETWVVNAGTRIRFENLCKAVARAQRVEA